VGSDVGVLVGDQEVGDFPREAGDEGNKLPNSPATDAHDLCGFRVCADGFFYVYILKSDSDADQSGKSSKYRYNVRSTD
jgi:hypothetical protein